MDYAEKILRKYGWQKGKGLGKEEKGISKPIRCGLKFDKAGIGYNEKMSKEESTRWWEQVYDKTASKIRSPESAVKETHVPNNLLTDEELFKACGGRTAHRAARHGLGLNGKLQRIRKQESETVPSCSSFVNANCNSDSTDPDKVNIVASITQPERSGVRNGNVGVDIDRKQKKRKKRQMETENEDVLVVANQEVIVTENYKSKKRKTGVGGAYTYDTVEPIQAKTIESPEVSEEPIKKKKRKKKK